MERTINYDENIRKTAGKRVTPDPLNIQPDEIENLKAWCRAIPSMRVCPGVFQFRSYEDADAWLMKKLIEAQT